MAGLWFTPMVAETYDGFLNDTDGFHVKSEHALEALKIAKTGRGAQKGAVGGGTGMVCFGFKGGIGTSSRIVTTPIGQYTVGVLVQCNFGVQTDLRIAGAAVGQELNKHYAPCTATPSPNDKVRACEARPDDKPGDGSMIVVVATDAPLLPHQLKRLAKRPGHAMGRLGDISRESSGDIFMAFSTANPQLNSTPDGEDLGRDVPEPLLNPLFEGVVRATEEAILNALVAAKTMTGRDGHRVYGLPHDEVRAIVSRNGARAAVTMN